MRAGCVAQSAPCQVTEAGRQPKSSADATPASELRVNATWRPLNKEVGAVREPPPVSSTGQALPVGQQMQRPLDSRLRGNDGGITQRSPTCGFLERQSTCGHASTLADTGHHDPHRPGQAPIYRLKCPRRRPDNVFFDAARHNIGSIVLAMMDRRGVVLQQPCR